MIDKTVSLAEAAALVKSGDILSLGGMNLYRRPVAFVRELLKTDVRDLTLLCFTASYESDLLIGARRVKTIRTCYPFIPTLRGRSGCSSVSSAMKDPFCFRPRATISL